MTTPVGRSRFFPDRAADCGHHTIFGNIPITTFAGEHVQMVVVEMPPHSVVQEHAHPHEQMGIVMAGRAVFTIGGESRELVPGDLYWMPGNVPHKVVTADAPLTAIDFFHPAREEYR